MRIYHLKGGFLDNSESVEPFALKFKSFCSKRVFWIIWYDNVFCYTSKSLEAEPPKLIKTVGIWNKIMFMCNGVDKLLTDTARRECPADLITLSYYYALLTKILGSLRLITVWKFNELLQNKVNLQSCIKVLSFIKNFYSVMFS